MEFNVKNGSIEKQRTGCVIIGDSANLPKN